MFGKQNAVSFLGILAFVALSSMPNRVSAQGEKAVDASKFRWIGPAADKTLWGQVQAAVNAKNGPSGPEHRRKIVRAGIYGSSALVVEETTDEPDATGHTYYLATNVDLVTRHVKEINQPGSVAMWQWTLVKLAHFSQEGAPDVVFRFKDCIDCESTDLLASFQFDEQKSLWRFRQWDPKAKPETGSYFLVGANMDTGETKSGVSVFIKTNCVYKVDDLKGEGLDELASWCRVTETTMDPPERRISRKDTTLLFAVHDGMGQIIEVREPAAILELHQKLCSGQQKPLCRDVTNRSDVGAKAPVH